MHPHVQEVGIKVMFHLCSICLRIIIMFSVLFVCVLLCLFGAVSLWRMYEHEERLRVCKREMYVLWEMEKMAHPKNINYLGIRKQLAKLGVAGCDAFLVVVSRGENGESKTLSPHEYADCCEADSPPDLLVSPVTGRQKRTVIVPIGEPTSDEEDECESNPRLPHFRG